MSPFLGLCGRCGGPPPAECARSFPSAGNASAAGSRSAEPGEVQDLSLTRFAQLFALAILGLAGLLSLGMGGVVLVQRYAFPAPGIGVRELGPGRLRFPSVPPHHRKVGGAMTHLGDAIEK